MILYHGSNTAFNVIDLGKDLPDKDYGRGLYLTDSLECAEKTARQRVARLGGAPKVMVFECDEPVMRTMNVRAFAAPSREWALFVRANRRTDENVADHNRDNRYDVVRGPIANDKLSLLFRLYERDIMTVDGCARGMQFRELYTQYSFHTERALAALRFEEVCDVA